MSDHLPFKLGLSQSFPCSYLDDEQERLLVVLDESFYSSEGFEQLLNMGFRRSGDQIYRPHCEHCSACQAIRIPTANFNKSKSQKRKFNKAKNFDLKISHSAMENYYPLYEKYINQRHKDGAMYPANYEQYQSFLICNWLSPLYFELWHDNQLIAVAVTDNLSQSLSAIYTFFDPDYADYSLGSVMILHQIEYAQRHAKHHLYLGYYIEHCNKMNYKRQFKPLHALENNVWHLYL